MAASKKRKDIIQTQSPSNNRTIPNQPQSGKRVAQQQNPNAFYQEYPCWNFHICDTEMWSFTQEHVGNLFWSEILPRLKAWESCTWQEIFALDGKNNHFINVETLTKRARKRLEELFIEEASIASLRINGTHRIYGFIQNQVFYILWFDDGHGNNDDCVCRSNLKHT